MDEGRPFLRFQSPSRRGRHFYLLVRGPAIARLLHFSPLREGDGTSTKSDTRYLIPWFKFQSPSRRGRHFYACVALISTQVHKFQSPSRRGRHFYAKRKCPTRIRVRISVPFAKGTALLHRFFLLVGGSFPYFSPLREGDGTSTSSGIAAIEKAADFSPLREGDGTSTATVSR